MHTFVSLAYAVLAVNLLGFVLTVCGVDVGWPFFLGTNQIPRADRQRMPWN
jgi:hypothetical protein